MCSSNIEANKSIGSAYIQYLKNWIRIGGQKKLIGTSLLATFWHIIRQQNLSTCVCVPAGGTDEGKGDELVPERIILRYGFRAHQGPEAGVIGQVTDVAGVGSHLSLLAPLSQSHHSSLLFHQAYAKSWSRGNALIFEVITFNKQLCMS